MCLTFSLEENHKKTESVEHSTFDLHSGNRESNATEAKHYKMKTHVETHSWSQAEVDSP